MRILFIMMAIAVIALSGCVEKGPSAEEIKKLTVKSASNLSSYGFSIEQKQTESIKDFDQRNGTYGANATGRLADAKIEGYVDLMGRKAIAELLTATNITGPGGIAENSTSGGTQYNIGNITYTKTDQQGWTQLRDPTPENEIWSSNRFNAIVSRVESINQSGLQLVGEENVDGYNAYKLKATLDSKDYYNTTMGLVSNAVFPFVAKLDQADLDRNSSIETLLWVDKRTYLPRKYENRVDIKVVPEIIGFFDVSRGQMAMLNKSIRPAQVSIESFILEKYFDFDKPMNISVPQEALATQPIVPMPIMVNPTET
jgi:outer membrane lipoprotein-sorting protein